MQQITYSASSSVTVNGITPSTGPGMVLLANPSFLVSFVTAGDYVANAFTVGATTPATAVDLGLITTGKLFYIQTSVPIKVTLTQNAIDNVIDVDNFLMINSSFTAVKIANTGVAAANISLVVVGDRATVSGPGIY